MKSSLKNSPDNKKEEVIEPADVDTTALAELEDHLPDTAPVTLALGSVSGSVDSRDIIIPKLNITQNVGPLSEEFEGGDIVYSKETVLVSKEVPIFMTVLSIKKTYEDRLPYDPNGPRPKVYETIEEVIEAGLWVDWRGNEAPPVREVGTMLVLIEQPDGVDHLGFNHEIEGKTYALAMWVARGSAYTRGAKKVFSASQIELAKGGLMSGKWELSTKREQINGNWVFVPVMRIVGKNSPEFIKQISDRLS